MSGENVKEITVNEQENVRTVQRLYQAFVAGDLATILNLVTDDVEFLPPVHTHASAVAGWGRAWRGREGAGQYLRTLAEALEFQIFEPDEFIVGRDSVVVLGPRTMPGAGNRPWC